MTSSTGIEHQYPHGRVLGELPPPAAPGPVVAPLPPAAVPLAASPAAPIHSPAASGPRLGRREKWVDLPAKTDDGEAAYPGFRIKFWLNYPQHWDQEMTGETFRPAPKYETATLEELRAWSYEREASMREAYGRVVLEHNGWLDHEGNPLPQPQDPRFWELIPTELAATIVALQKQATAELPNSIQPRRRR